MPIFEFRCKECCEEFKTLRRAEKLAEVTCPSCGTEKVMRLLSVTAQTTGAETNESCAMPMGGCCAMNPAACGCRN